MRIALFTETFLPKIDGVVTIIHQMHEQIHARGHEMIIYAPPGAPSSFNGSTVYPSWGPPFPLYPELHCSFPTWQGIRAISSFRPNIIHVMNPTFIGAAGITMATIGKVPLVASVHMDINYYVKQYAGTWGLPIAWRFFNYWHNKADINLAPSQVTCQQLRDHGIARVQQWQRGIDLTRFRRYHVDAQIRARLCNGDPTRVVALYVGRLSREKCIADLVAVASLAHVQLVLVGGGPESAHIQDLFAGTGAHFTGILRGEELIDVYNSADIFVFPSQSETFGLAPLEAMACGLPVVAPYVGGLTETMQHMENGLVYDAADPSQLVTHVIRLRDDGVLRARLAAQAYAYAQTRDWHQSMDDLVNCYEALVESKTNATP